MVHAITSSNFDQEVMQSTKPVILDIAASWCGPCQMMKPIFHQVAEELKDTYTFGQVDIDESRDLAIKFGITSVPSFIFIKDGVIVGKERGYMSQVDLKAKIEQIFA
ncbi:TPA: thiol reductase thioredoxin [Candidatus Dependentiae bacterium]|nr:thiol reductase thioredoxin [Candidatus Dependentiae bacterium]